MSNFSAEVHGLLRELDFTYYPEYDCFLLHEPFVYLEVKRVMRTQDYTMLYLYRSRVLSNGVNFQELAERLVFTQSAEALASLLERHYHVPVTQRLRIRRLKALID